MKGLTKLVLAGLIISPLIGTTSQAQKPVRPEFEYFLDKGIIQNLDGGLISGSVIVSGDLNGDGYQDMIIARSGPSDFELRYFENDGDVNFVYKGIVGKFPIIEGNNKIDLVLIDLNNDGRKDILTVTRSDYGYTWDLRYFQNNMPQK